MLSRILFVPALLMLAACGGGGGGGNDSTNEPPPPPPPTATEPDAPVVDYSGNTDPAQVGKSNVIHWAGLTVRMRALSEQVEALWIDPPDEPGEISLTRQGDGGGSASAEGLLRGDGTGFLEVTFDDYVQDGTTVSGRYIQRYVPPTAPQAGHIFSAAGPGRLELDNLELTFAGQTYTLLGALEISGGNHQHFGIDLLVTTGATGDVVYYESCAIDFVDVPVFSTSEIGAALSGTINDSEMGAVTITPTGPLLNLGFFEPAGFTVADPGGGFVIESAGPPFEFRSLSTGFAALLLDSDGDGVREDARRAAWSEIAGSSVRPVATPPVANAGELLVGDVGFDFNAHGLFSHDPDGDWLTFEWRFLWTPRGSQVELANFSNPVVNFEPDLEGDYLLGLRVSDGTEVRESTVLARVDLFNPVAARGDSTLRGGLELVEPFIAGVPVTINGRSAAVEPYLDNPVRWFAVGPGNPVLTESPDRFVRTFSTDTDGLYTVNMENVEVTFPVGPQLDRVGVEFVDPQYHAFDVLANDFNQDGKIDLALRLAGMGFPADMQGFRLMVADAGGGFVDGPALDTGRGEIAAGDLSGDGRPDFAVSDPLGVYVSLQLPDHSLTEFALHPFPPGCTPFTPGDIGIGDVDGDGLNDLLAVALCDNSLVVWRQQADHLLAAANVVFNDESIRYAAFGHFDSDTLIDAAVSAAARDGLPTAVAVARAQPGGTFQVTERIAANEGFTHPVLTVADTNGDGRDDIVSNDFVHGIRLHEQQLDGSFTAESIIPTGSAELTAALGAGDIDDDGDVDILVCSHRGLFAGVRQADDLWSYFEYGTCANRGESMNNFAVVTDFNGDGNSDVVATSENVKAGFSDSRILLDVFLGNVSNYSRPVQ